MSGEYLPEDDGTLVVNAADAAQVDYGRRAEQRRFEHRRAVLLQQLSTVEGREYVWEQLRATGLYEDCLPTDPVVMGRFLGRRSVGLELLAEFTAYGLETEYLAMQREAMHREKRERLENAAAHTASAQAETAE